MTTLSENTVRRLVLIKQMFLHGSSYASEAGELGRVISIQSTDYSIEMLLKTIVSHFGPPNTYETPQNGHYNNISSLQNQKYNPWMDFYRLWDEFQAIFRDPLKGINAQLLPLRQEIDILHSMRNDVQHNGITPSNSEVDKYIL